MVIRLPPTYVYRVSYQVLISLSMTAMSPLNAHPPAMGQRACCVKLGDITRRHRSQRARRMTRALSLDREASDRECARPTQTMNSRVLPAGVLCTYWQQSQIISPAILQDRDRAPLLVVIA